MQKKIQYVTPDKKEGLKGSIRNAQIQSSHAKKWKGMYELFCSVTSFSGDKF